ncbi:unnamed protein product [Parajaminaea phylloscopi]
MLAAVTTAAVVGIAAAQAAFQQTPTLGYNTYNAVSCSPDDAYVRRTIDALDSQGFVAAGYNIFQIDCGWQARDRSRNGAINVDTKAFPNGIRALSDYAGSKRMKWGMYSDAGKLACDPTVPSPVLGSLGHEDADAKQFADWNTYTVKYDNCYAGGETAADNAPKDPRTDFPSRFSPMTTALRKYGIQGELICQWGVPFQSSSGLQGPVDWTKSLATSFRLSDDIADNWDAVYRIYNQAIYVAGTNKTGPGFHADADLLEVGNKGLSPAEQQFHFAYWAMAKSALMISTDIVGASQATRDILLNKGLIAINQDALGKPIQLVQRYSGQWDLHAGPLSGGDQAVLAFNARTSSAEINIDFAALGVASADVVDLYSGAKSAGAKSYKATVGAHGVIALRLSKVKLAPASRPTVNWIEAESATLEGSVKVASCSGCSGGKKAGDIGGGAGNNLVFKNVKATAATQTVLIDYVNAEIGYLGQGNNERTARFAVNGGEGQQVTFPISGYNWDADVKKGYRVQLSGFTVGSANTIQISSSSYAPDVDRLGVLA